MNIVIINNGYDTTKWVMYYITVYLVQSVIIQHCVKEWLSAVLLVYFTAAVVWATFTTAGFIAIKISFQSQFSCLAIFSCWPPRINVYPSNTPPCCPRLCLWILNMKEFVCAHVSACSWATTIPAYGIHPSLWPDGHVSTARCLSYDVFHYVWSKITSFLTYLRT